MPGWLEPMVDLLMNPALNAGIAGNIQRRVVDDTIDHAGVYVTPLAKIEHIRETSPAAPSCQRTFAVTGACCLLFRQDFIDVGGFDEQFVNGAEHVDLCLKLRALGKLVYVANNSVIKQHVSLSRDRTSLVNEQNSRLLFAKWRSLIIQEVCHAWVRLLNTDLSPTALPIDFQLKQICYRTPHIAAWLIANYLLCVEETRWQLLFEPDIVNDKCLVESCWGFTWDDQSPYAYSPGSAGFILAKGCLASNFFISGKILPGAVNQRVCLGDLQLCVEVNGVQQQCWPISEAGHFNWALANPILSTRFPSIITFSLKNKLQEVKATAICQQIRFAHILLDDQVILNLQCR